MFKMFCCEHETKYSLEYSIVKAILNQQFKELFDKKHGSTAVGT